ncbi:MAG: POTRA domain-containing protein, partial [Candidatus Puniceispirillales bacterium]
MKNKFIQLSALIFLFCTAQVYSNPINKINFIGLNNTSESALLALIPFEIGQKFSPYASDKIIEALFETELFENISIIKNDNSLDISLKENPTIKYFEITLNNDSAFSNWLKNEKIYFTSDVLNEQIAENQLSVGNVFTKRKLEDFLLLLESKYSESGYFNSVITQDTEIDVQNRAGIELSVTQGNRATIDSFGISGSEKISEKELLKLFKIGEPDMALINYFTNKDDFTDSKLRNGINLMTQTYFDSGYLDFKVLDVKSSLNENKEKLSINIEVSEGIQYKLGDVSFEGELGNISLSVLNNTISMLKGDVFNRNLIIQDIQSLTDLFADQGYAFVKINPITSDFLDSVNINFEISLNKKTYLNRITISG